MIRDTRETAYNDKMTQENSTCRFNPGDIVLMFHRERIKRAGVQSVYWDKSFGGWLVSFGLIGIHEQNFILASEEDLWEPHNTEEPLWVYWTRKEYY